MFIFVSRSLFILNNMATATKWPLTNQELAEMVDDDGQFRFSATLQEYWELLTEANYRADYFNNQIIATTQKPIHLRSKTTLDSPRLSPCQIICLFSKDSKKLSVKPSLFM